MIKIGNLNDFDLNQSPWCETSPFCLSSLLFSEHPDEKIICKCAHVDIYEYTLLYMFVIHLWQEHYYTFAYLWHNSIYQEILLNGSFIL